MPDLGRLVRHHSSPPLSGSASASATARSGWTDAGCGAAHADPRHADREPFHGEGHRKVWARLRLRGVRTSKRRVLRLMRNHDLLAPSRVGTPRGPRNHDGTIIPETVDTMWGTDLTTTWTAEGQVAVFIAIDHYSAECVGIHAARRATRFEALEPIRQGVRQRFGGFDAQVASGLSVRHDHGSQYMSDAFQAERRSGHREFACLRPCTGRQRLR